ncbi:MAG: ABC transporter substrate-binding protein [Deltaproteobacteria bacterium]|nr:ABC transporter substrate-binding protein [Deltaproteobacteria bacterium]
MARKWIIITMVLVFVVAATMASGPAQAADKDKTQFFGILIYRTGPFAAGGSGFGSGWEDFMQLRNMQGGVNGIKYAWEECETAYNTARGVECYERLKDKMVLVHPLSTGITYALIPRATKEHKVIFSAPLGFPAAHKLLVTEFCQDQVHCQTDGRDG